MTDCYVCPVGKSHQLALPKTTDHKVNLPFQLFFVDLMEPLTPEALTGHKHVAKISDEYAKWTEIYLLTSKHDALSSFKISVHSVMIPSGFRVERSRADKGGQFTGKDFQNCCLQTGVSLEFASTNTPQQTVCPTALEEFSQVWWGARSPTTDCHSFSGNNWYSQRRSWGTERHIPRSACSPRTSCCMERS